MILPDISVIVPVFNSASYLYESLRSLQLQTFKNFEVLIVDDGSTDDSYQIASFFSNSDSRFKLYKKKNGGVSEARNFAIKFASGQFLSFVDSDDIVDKNFLSDMFTAAQINNADIVVSGFYFWFENGDGLVRSGPQVTKNISRKDFLEGIFLKDYQSKDVIGGFLYNKLFSKKIVGNLCLNQELCVGEDEVFCTQIADYTQRISCIETPLYYYRYRSNSLSHRENFYFEQLKARKFICQNISEEFLPMVIAAYKRSLLHALYGASIKRYMDKTSFIKIKYYCDFINTLEYERKQHAFHSRNVYVLLFFCVKLLLRLPYGFCANFLHSFSRFSNIVRKHAK